MMVICGFTLHEEGKRPASATQSRGVPCTRPTESLTAARGFSPMRAVPCGHPAGRLVGDERAEGPQAREARHALFVRRADAGEYWRLERGGYELALDEDALAREVVHVVGLRHLFPAAHLLVEQRADAGG